MPFVIKSHSKGLSSTRAPSADFVEWAYRGAAPRAGIRVAWFTAETSGGFGLYALGRIASDGVDAGKNAKGNKLVAFQAEFSDFEPQQTLGNSDFEHLERIGHGSPIQNLNRCLYMNSHVKVAEVDDETFDFIVSRF